MSEEKINNLVKNAHQFDVALRINYRDGGSNPDTIPLLDFVQVINELRKNDFDSSNNNELRGAELIAEERKRQIEKEGFDSVHDDLHNNEELVYAAICYAGRPFIKSNYWPSNWNFSWWKPSPSNRVKELVKAGAVLTKVSKTMQMVQISHF